MAVLLALLSSCLWGAGDFLGGLRSKTRSAYAVVAGSQFAGLLAITAVALVVGAYDAPYGWIGWSVLAGLVGAMGLVAFYIALAVGTMGVVSPIAGLGVAVPVIVGFMRGEEPTVVQGVGITVALIGALATSGPEFRAAASARAVALAAFSGGCFGTVFVAIDRGAEFSPVMTMVGMRLSSVVAFGLVALALRTAGGLDRSDVPALAAVGLFDMAANLLFAIASTLGYVSIVSVLGSLYPVVTVLLARVVLRERLHSLQTTGVAATLLGVGLISAG